MLGDPCIPFCLLSSLTQKWHLIGAGEVAPGVCVCVCVCVCVTSKINQSLHRPRGPAPIFLEQAAITTSPEFERRHVC